MTAIERLQQSGILRRGSPRRGFHYRHAGGRRVSRADRIRVQQLRLPPAWRDVVIAASPGARLQAVGRDAAGRWQYVYHASHVRRREQRKYERLLKFGQALPALRRAVARDQRLPGLTRDKVLAVIMRILACAYLRPGSEAYAAENGSYGIATLRRKHVRVRGDTVIFDFVGKSGKHQHREIRDRRIARCIRQLMQLSGYEIFKYVAHDGTTVDLRSTDINEYIKRHMGAGFSARDFRTWSGTLICACALAQHARALPASVPERKRAVAGALRETAAQLGNTPAICRSSYVSPCVLNAFDRGDVIAISSAAHGAMAGVTTRRAPEIALLRLLGRAYRHPSATQRN
jgi:DNA topoisomerase I